LYITPHHTKHSTHRTIQTHHLPSHPLFLTSLTQDASSTHRTNTSPLLIEIHALSLILKRRHVGINLRWVIVHVGVPGNEEADQAAVAAARAVQQARGHPPVVQRGGAVVELEEGEGEEEEEEEEKEQEEEQEADFEEAGFVEHFDLFNPS